MALNSMLVTATVTVPASDMNDFIGYPNEAARSASVPAIDDDVEPESFPLTSETVLNKFGQNAYLNNKGNTDLMKVGYDIVADIRDGKISSDAEMAKLATETLGLNYRVDIFYNPFPNSPDKTTGTIFPGLIINSEEEKAAVEAMGFKTWTHEVPSPVRPDMVSTFIHLPFAGEVTRTYADGSSEDIDFNFQGTLRAKLLAEDFPQDKKKAIVDALMTFKSAAWKAKRAENEMEDLFQEIVELDWQFSSQTDFTNHAPSEDEPGVFFRFTAVLAALDIADKTLACYLYESAAGTNIHFKQHILQPIIGVQPAGYKVNEEFVQAKLGWSIYMGQGTQEFVKFGVRTDETAALMNSVVGDNSTYATKKGRLYANPSQPIPGGPFKTLYNAGDKEWHEKAPTLVSSTYQGTPAQALEDLKTAYWRSAHFTFPYHG